MTDSNLGLAVITEHEVMERSKHELLKRKNELLVRLAAIRGDLGRGLDPDSEEQALQLQNFEVLQEIERLANQELLDIEEELAQLDGDN